MIVDNVCKIVRRHSVGLYENIILEILAIYGYFSEYHIRIRCSSAFGNILSYNVFIAAGKTLILPRCAAEHAIDLCVVRSMDDLEAGAYGILEPKMNCALVTAADIDFAVVPCLSFDRKGRRLGQGGGYYDRLLPQLRCPTALICREQLMSPEVPVEEHDMRCTMLITEKGILTPEA